MWWWSSGTSRIRLRPGGLGQRQAPAMMIHHTVNAPRRSRKVKAPKFAIAPDRRIRRRLRRSPLMLVPSADRQLWAAVGADDQLWVVRVYRRTGISVDRLAMHPLDEVAGRERPHARGVPGEAGVVEEVAPLAARAAAEERGGIDPVLRTAAGDGRAGPAAHRLERRRLDQAGPSVLVDVDAEARGQLPHLPLQVGL